MIQFSGLKQQWTVFIQHRILLFSNLGWAQIGCSFADPNWAPSDICGQMLVNLAALFLGLAGYGVGQ